MARTSLAAADLEEYLSTQDSFALELRVLRYASGLGFSATHGGSYVDPVLGKQRQYDLRASTVSARRLISLSIECKSLQGSAPLLVSRMPRSGTESFHNLVYLSKMATSIHPRIDINPAGRTPYARGSLVGKSLAQPTRNQSGWKDSENDLHDKWMQAVNSSIALVENAVSPRGDIDVAAIVPCLVVSDETLWVVDYDLDGTVTSGPQQVDEATYFVGRTFTTRPNPYVFEFTASHLHIFTETGIRQRLNELDSSRVWWDELFEPAA